MSLQGHLDGWIPAASHLVLAAVLGVGTWALRMACRSKQEARRNRWEEGWDDWGDLDD